jgi:hypothetical protein
MCSNARQCSTEGFRHTHGQARVTHCCSRIAPQVKSSCTLAKTHIAAAIAVPRLPSL